MSGIWITGRDVVESMAELVGFKLGLSVTEEQLEQSVRQHDMAGLWPDDLEATYRYRPEALEQLAQTLLAAYGDPDAAGVAASPLTIFPLSREFSDFDGFMEVVDYVLPRLTSLPLNEREDALDPTQLVTEVAQRWGRRGVEVTARLMSQINARVTSSPWSRIRRVCYDSRIELRELFASESLPLPLGLFFDQRFVDYLDANAAELSRMHWRQFEGLVAERLRREGMKVELGPGRADGGVDVRAWDPAAPDGAPAVLLVQCKRTHQRVDLVVVKALAADVMFEGAQKGMVATTSSWSPGARSTVTGRGYPIDEVNRDTLLQWLTQMRSPGSGLWLPRRFEDT
ncbi:restriction endonuclease [Streptomyces sp. DSM 41982]|uniref:Restriction endonuclease n=1 Tax=Streptomyces evansiae TaxID=3075535 RepID=A0ABD5EFQ6_9ACTN|nr:MULTISPECIES: restriction endonuclease [unclassified Streptomyces]MDT0419617.1 restriction endonuclease [Streptomyces sp. DSM 41982]SCE27601.1 restriction system protein [Streptomyces sp. SolWspMP-sol7th]